MQALLSTAPVEPPRAKPLTFREPEAPARPLPEGRGFLRVVAQPTPALRGATPRHDLPPPPAPVPAPKPAPRRPAQLSLFDPPTKPGQ